MKTESGRPVRTVSTYNTLHSNRQEVSVVPAPLNGGQALPCAQIVVQAHPDNDQRVVVGNALRQDVELVAGQSETIPIDDVSKIWVRAAAGVQQVNWHAVDQTRL